MTALEGKDNLFRRLDAIGNGRQLLRGIQMHAVAEAKRLVPRKTGHLGRSIGPGELTPEHAIVEARANYAVFVERGTKPHVIRPRNRRSLAWPASPGGARLSGRARTGTRRGQFGGMRFAKVVHHPGTKAKPFLMPGARFAVKKAGAADIVKLWNEAA